MNQLANLTPDTTDNIGGMELCFFVPEEDIEAFPDAEGLVLRGDITLKEGKVWHLIGYTRYTSRYEQKLKQDFRNGLYAVEQGGFLPTDSPVLGNQLLFMKNRRFVLLFRDYNGYLRVTPPGYPVTFTDSFDTKDQPSDRKGYRLSFEAKTPWPAFYYSGGFEVSELGLVQAPAEAGTGGTPVTVYFNGQVVKVLQPGESLDVTSPYSLAFNIKFA